MQDNDSKRTRQTKNRNLPIIPVADYALLKALLKTEGATEFSDPSQGNASCDDCTEEHLCAIRWIMKDVRDASARILDQTTLDQLLNKAKDINCGPALEYQV